MHLRTVFLIGMFITGAFAQPPLVKSIVPLFSETREQYYHPQFSPDDSRLLLTKSNFQGLFEYHLETGDLKTVTDETGAGYQPAYSVDGQTIYYRTSVMNDRQNYFSLVRYNSATGEKIIVEAGKRDLSPPQNLASGSVVYTTDNEIREIEIAVRQKKAVCSTPYAQIHESKSIRITAGEEAKVIQPKGNRMYLWPSVSPDSNRLLFTVAGMGTFISDLDGNILVELGQANVPSWSPDGKWIVFMRDIDDGHLITASDIYIANADGSSVMNITSTPNIIELYPNWSHEGSKIVCSTDDGAIYLINLEWK
ncbi:MAG: hypothetical protein ABIA75_06340 [Candidatus Neomarinimicrobiota bacterium]